jgi:ABC-type glycerol-3-phosphate transport system substrate-binding protein
MTMRALAVAGLITCAALMVAPVAKAQETTLEVWSHEADEPAKVAFRELAARNLEKKHPGLKVKITWYEKNPLFAALKTALPAGKGPDVFYLEPDQTEYITSGYIVRSTTRSTGTTSSRGRARCGRTTARRTASRRRPIPSSCTTTRTC